MDIKVNEYVRTKFGYIAKLESIYISEYTGETIYECDSTVYMDYGDPVRYFEGKDELGKFVVKHSFDIIDLIEYGDYINEEFVGSVDYEKKTVEIGEGWTVKHNEIENVVTKETFDSIKYEVIKWI